MVMGHKPKFAIGDLVVFIAGKETKEILHNRIGIVVNIERRFSGPALKRYPYVYHIEIPGIPGPTNGRWRTKGMPSRVKLVAKLGDK